VKIFIAAAKNKLIVSYFFNNNKKKQALRDLLKYFIDICFNPEKRHAH